MKDGSKVDNILMEGWWLGLGVGGGSSSIGSNAEAQGGSTAPGAVEGWGAIMASPAGPLGGACSCSAPLLAALSHYCVCLGKISNVKALQHPEHAVKGDVA